MFPAVIFRCYYTEICKWRSSFLGRGSHAMLYYIRLYFTSINRSPLWLWLRTCCVVPRHVTLSIIITKWFAARLYSAENILIDIVSTRILSILSGKRICFGEIFILKSFTPLFCGTETTFSYFVYVLFFHTPLIGPYNIECCFDVITVKSFSLL